MKAVAEEVAEKFFFITGKSVQETGEVSFKFMFDSGAPRDLISRFSRCFGNRYAWLRQRRKGDDEFDPWKLVRGESGAIGDDGVMRWDFFVFETRKGNTLSVGFEESPEEEGLRQLFLEDTPSCVILTSRVLFEKAAKVLEASDIKFGVHHFDGELETS